MKKKIRKLFREMIPVVLGILIALFINNWKESRDDRKFMDSVFESIQEEFEENKAELEEKIPEHRILLDTIQEYAYIDSIAISDILNKVGGIKGVSIKNTSWRSFINPNIQLVDYEMISLLTDIDEGKQHMKLQIEKLLDLIYSSASDDSTDKKLLLHLLINDLLYTEEGLLEDHIAFLESLKTRK